MAITPHRVPQLRCRLRCDDSGEAARKETVLRAQQGLLDRLTWEDG